MSEPTEARVKEIIINELGVEPEKVTNDASFVEDLGADSLDTVELVMAFEEEFGIDIPFAPVGPGVEGGTYESGCSAGGRHRRRRGVSPGMRRRFDVDESPRRHQRRGEDHRVRRHRGLRHPHRM